MNEIDYSKEPLGKSRNNMDKTGVLNTNQLHAVHLHLEGKSKNQIAKILKVAAPTVTRWMESERWMQALAYEAQERSKGIRLRYLNRAMEVMDLSGEILVENLRTIADTVKDGQDISKSGVLNIVKDLFQSVTLASHAVDPSIGGKETIESQQNEQDTASRLRDEWDKDEASIITEAEKERLEQTREDNENGTIQESETTN